MIDQLGLSSQNYFIFKFNHSSWWIKELNILLTQSTKNKLNNSSFGRFELTIHLYNLINTQSPLNLKKIFVQNKSKKHSTRCANRLHNISFQIQHKKARAIDFTLVQIDCSLFKTKNSLFK